MSQSPGTQVMERAASSASAAVAPEALVVVDRVSKRFVLPGRPPALALQEVSFQVAAGEFLCILGPSGCGKSTLLNMLAGFTAPSTGELRYRGRPVTGPGPDRTMVFQDYALFDWMTVADNVAFGLVANGTPAAERRRRVMALLELVGLTTFATRYPHELSGGMRQRVGLARALAPDPDVILLDEPFAALDLLTRELMQEEMLRLQQDSGKTFILITHSVEEAVFLGNRVLLMSTGPGRIEEDLTIDLPTMRTAEMRTENKNFLAYREHLSALLRRGLRIT